ncbi:MAG: DUF1573 domain-containing protein [Lentisphaeria bacterium]|jgi:hypothetical protein|nr:DUF1573 domain-containing protein [Lentisphaeria bacterium]MDP7740921.1 DUF1573 domain-containing protein [Lentisphaeria bacterium]
MRAVLIITGLLLAGGVVAQLQFESTELELRGLPNDTTLSGAYRFTNIGETEITVKTVKTSCGCTTTGLDKKTYAPGESGEISATIKVREGVSEKKITVTTDEPSKETTTLIIRGIVPRYVDIDPPYVKWQVGDSAKRKKIRLKFLTDADINITSVTANKDAFEYELLTLKAGRHYELLVTPVSTKKSSSVQFSFVTDYPPDVPQTFHASARVVPVTQGPNSLWDRFQATALDWIAR